MKQAVLRISLDLEGTQAVKQGKGAVSLRDLRYFFHCGAARQQSKLEHISASLKFVKTETESKEF